MLLHKPIAKTQIAKAQIAKAQVEPILQKVYPEQSSVFMTHTEISTDDMAGKITYTNVYKSIPANRTPIPVSDWQNKYDTEWRWRFLKIKMENDTIKNVIEISYIKKDSNDRMYFNRYGKWVQRNIDPIFNQFVVEEYYVYS